MPEHSSQSIRQRGATWAAAAVSAHGAFVLVGWWAGWRTFTSPPPTFIPMAPSTALAFLILGVTLLVSMIRRDGAETRGAVTLVGWALALAMVLNLVIPERLDAFLGGATGQFGSVALGVMSPVTAGALLALAIAVALLSGKPRLAGPVATIATLIGATVVLGYAYGTPLLYGSGTIPVALPTGLSLVLLGGAVAAAVGPDAWPLQPFAGDSPRARMLRAFLPATTGLIVIVGLVNARIAAPTGLEQVLVTAWLALGGVALITLLISRLSVRVGADVEKAYTERHRAERRYTEIFEETPAGIATLATDGRIRLCNSAFARMFGHDVPGDLIGESVNALYWAPEDQDRVVAGLMESGSLRNVELRGRRKDGTAVWILANLTRHHDMDGEHRIEIAVVDITKRKVLEQQLWQAQKLDELGSLAGGVAHDFNNILTAIMAYAELVQAGLKDGDPHADDLREIRKACDRATALTRQLLAFSRRQPFEPSALRLDERVRDMEPMIRRLLGPEVRLETIIGDVVAPVWGDPGHIEQIVLNLAVNARDAMPKGGTITVETRALELSDTRVDAHDQVPAGEYPAIIVRDTGIGMDDATLAHIFEPFFTTKEKGRGTGLGLATVWGIVKQSRGYILVDSAPGKGTAFTCLFPPTDAPVVSPVRAEPRGRIEGNETIVVVEDEVPILNAVTAALSRYGYRVIPTTDGEKAQRIIEEHDGPIHLVLTDGVLSGIRIPVLLRRVRVERPDARILVMSGYAQESVFGSQDVDIETAFLAKPFTLRSLAARVREVLDAPSGRHDQARQQS